MIFLQVGSGKPEPFVMFLPQLVPQGANLTLRNSIQIMSVLWTTGEFRFQPAL